MHVFCKGRVRRNSGGHRVLGKLMVDQALLIWEPRWATIAHDRVRSGVLVIFLVVDRQVPGAGEHDIACEAECGTLSPPRLGDDWVVHLVRLRDWGWPSRLARRQSISTCRLIILSCC